jgi:predicted dehydrogenase
MTVRVGLIGVGDVAERDYLPEWHRLDGRAEIAWICSRTAERAARVAATYHIERWFTEYNEALSEGTDAVLNLTPIPLHYDVTRAALEAGMHVYSEKPLAFSSLAARALERVARERHLLLACAPSSVLFPQVVKAKEIVDAGRIGIVRSARAQAIAGVPPWPGYLSDPTPFFAADAGPLVDMGVYPLHVLTSLLGPVRRVAALADRTREEFTIVEGPYAGNPVSLGSDDEWQLLLSSETCIASVEANFATAWSSSADCELRGDLGSLAFSLFDVSAPLKLLESGEDDFVEIPVTHERSSGPDHLLGVQHLVDCIEKQVPLRLTAAHAIHVLEIIEAARDAASSGRTISVAPPPTGVTGSPRVEHGSSGR